MQRGHLSRSLLAAVLFLGGATTLSAQQPPGLLIEVAAGGAAADQLAAGDRTRVRARTVRVDLPQLGTREQRRTPGQSLLLNLFDDASYSATLDRIDQTSGGFVWVGHIPDVAMSTVTLAIEDGAIYGSVLTPAATFVIRSAGNGLHLVAQIDQSAFRPEADAREVDAPPRRPGRARRYVAPCRRRLGRIHRRHGAVYARSRHGRRRGLGDERAHRQRDQRHEYRDEHLVLNNTAFTVANFRRMPLAVTSMTPDMTFPVPTATPVSWTVAASWRHLTVHLQIPGPRRHAVGCRDGTGARRTPGRGRLGLGQLQLAGLAAGMLDPPLPTMPGSALAQFGH